MNEIKLTVRAIAGQMEMNLKELAEVSGIDYEHLRSVAYKKVKLTIDDAIRLKEVSGVPIENMEF